MINFVSVCQHVGSTYCRLSGGRDFKYRSFQSGCKQSNAKWILFAEQAIK